MEVAQAAKLPDLPEGYPGAATATVHHKDDATKSEKILGMKYRSIEETVVDGLNSLRERFPSPKSV